MNSAGRQRDRRPLWAAGTSRRALVIAAALLLSWTGPALAAEVDSFGVRPGDLADASAALDAETDRLLEEAVARANAAPGGCHERELYDAILELMDGPIVGRLEIYIRDSAAVPHVFRPRSESIYRDFSFFETPSLAAGEGRLAALTRIGDHLVGGDKFGHFFSQGFVYFETAILDGEGLEAALRYGDRTERSYYGALLTGVYSYADQVANLHGLRFWMALLGYAVDPLTRARPQAYLECRDGRWEKVRAFHWADYVDAAWDESINCNLFRNDALLGKVEAALADIATGPSTCPRKPGMEPALRNRYGPLFERLVNLRGFGVLEDHPPRSAGTAPHPSSP